MSPLLDRIESPADLKRLTPEELPALAAEVRQRIIETVAANGGHLGGPLGTVELAVALHYVFESPHDRIVWDVGHQAYAHKLLTGRRDRFHTLRQPDGISGFCKREESVHDSFGAGHASTAISAALGILEGKRHKGDEGKVIAVVGDGGLTGGLAYEGLNNSGPLEKDLIVVLNDNDFSISPNVGAISLWLSRKLTGERMTWWRRAVKESLRAWGGERVIRAVQRAMEASKSLLTPGILFEGMGFEYVGPVPGHDLAQLVDTFRAVKAQRRPILIHAVTTKGKGYGPAEKHHEGGHGMTPFDVATGKAKPAKPGPPSWTKVFADTLVELAEKDPRVVAITAAMPSGTGLDLFQKKLPARCYDVGIAEQHAVCFAAGLATEGLRPVCAIYSTFLQRAYDQIIHDVAIQELPVFFCLDRAGLVGADGKTHQGAFDLAYLRCIPGMVVMAPKDEDELRHMIATGLAHPGPAAVRYPRGPVPGVKMEGPPRPLPIGRGEIVADNGGRAVAIVAVGTMVEPAVAAAAALAGEGVGAVVVNARFVKPLDEELLTRLAAECGAVVTVEEGTSVGGFGAAVLELLARRGMHGVRVEVLGLPDEFVEQGDVKVQRKAFRLDREGIAAAARALLARPATSEPLARLRSV
ncbi:MAG TPA: 1-deoxy-D-xylulose-5-phosphate synthase [Myxococcota bacterium]|jgi:1-deoxy-D-xylulose-5-phosphate synthase|nr:1-deoxy-D-xylulose-5-phosphate synthase [Myxococcota bacterium]